MVLEDVTGGLPAAVSPSCSPGTRAMLRARQRDEVRTTFRLLPRDTTVSVGGRVTTALRIFDAQGAPVAVTPRASDVFFLLRGNVPENELPPTLPPILVQDLNTYTFRTNRAGRVEMVAILHVHGRPDLRDSTFVTAR